MARTIEHVHWPDAPDLWMPYAPAIKVRRLDIQVTLR